MIIFALIIYLILPSQVYAEDGKKLKLINYGAAGGEGKRALSTLGSDGKVTTIKIGTNEEIIHNCRIRLSQKYGDKKNSAGTFGAPYTAWTKCVRDNHGDNIVVLQIPKDPYFKKHNDRNKSIRKKFCDSIKHSHCYDFVELGATAYTTFEEFKRGVKNGASLEERKKFCDKWVTRDDDDLIWLSKREKRKSGFFGICRDLARTLDKDNKVAGYTWRDFTKMIITSRKKHCIKNLQEKLYKAIEKDYLNLTVSGVILSPDSFGKWTEFDLSHMKTNDFGSIKRSIEEIRFKTTEFMRLAEVQHCPMEDPFNALKTLDVMALDSHMALRNSKSKGKKENAKNPAQVDFSGGDKDDGVDIKTKKVGN